MSSPYDNRSSMYSIPGYVQHTITYIDAVPCIWHFHFIYDRYETYGSEERKIGYWQASAAWYGTGQHCRHFPSIVRNMQQRSMADSCLVRQRYPSGELRAYAEGKWSFPPRTERAVYTDHLLRQYGPHVSYTLRLWCLLNYRFYGSIFVWTIDGTWGGVCMVLCSLCLAYLLGAPFSLYSPVLHSPSSRIRQERSKVTARVRIAFRFTMTPMGSSILWQIFLFASFRSRCYGSCIYRR